MLFWDKIYTKLRSQEYLENIHRMLPRQNLKSLRWLNFHFLELYLLQLQCKIDISLSLVGYAYKIEEFKLSTMLNDMIQKEINGRIYLNLIFEDFNTLVAQLGRLCMLLGEKKFYRIEQTLLRNFSTQQDQLIAPFQDGNKSNPCNLSNLKAFLYFVP